MCQICTAVGIATGGPDHEEVSGAGGSLTRNSDGTYNLCLTETQLNNLAIRLALSVLAERRGW